MLEKDIEWQLTKGIRSIGGRCLKFVSPGFTGVPDRIILLPGGRIFFAELKQKGKFEKARQKLVHKMLRELGFTVYNTVDSIEKINAIIQDCMEVTHGKDL